MQVNLILLHVNVILNNREKLNAVQTAQDGLKKQWDETKSGNEIAEGIWM